ncbi:hypothetical protein L3Q82_026788, partial [Scortum barcoo]
MFLVELAHHSRLLLITSAPISLPLRWKWSPASGTWACIHISDDLTWSKNTSCLIRKAHQRLYFLRRLRRAGLGSSVLTSFYRCVVESVLSSCIIVWHGSCSAAEKKALQRVVKAAQRTVGRSLPTTTDIYTFQMQETGLLHHEGPHSHCTRT